MTHSLHALSLAAGGEAVIGAGGQLTPLTAPPLPTLTHSLLTAVTPPQTLIGARVVQPDTEIDVHIICCSLAYTVPCYRIPTVRDMFILYAYKMQHNLPYRLSCFTFHLQQRKPCPQLPVGDIEASPFLPGVGEEVEEEIGTGTLQYNLPLLVVWNEDGIRVVTRGGIGGVGFIPIQHGNGSDISITV